MDGDATLAVTFDLRTLPDSFYENPYPTYHALRREAPVLRLPDGAWLLTGHAELVRVYRDPALFSSAKKVEFLPKFGDSPLYEHHTNSLVFSDPPLHTRVRRAMVGALTSRAIVEMEAAVEELVARLLDRAERLGRFDLIGDFAAAIPVEVIGNLLGVPHDERGPLRDWSLAILGALEPSITPEMFAAGNRAVVEFIDYLRILVAARRRRPGDPAHDVLTRLIQGEAGGEAGGEPLSETELLQNCIFILNAGHETTTNLIGNALYALLEWPAEAARLRSEPGLMRTAVEEFLRFESPVQLGNRRALAAAEVGGIALPEGALVTLALGAANRDPAVFADPDRLDLAREPNRHLAFAFGIHQCVGLNVARMEGRIAIGRFLARFPRYRLAGPALRGMRARFRGFLSIPVEAG